MKKYAFIFTAFLIAATLIGCGNPAGGNEDTRSIGAFEPGIWFYDYDGGDAEKAAQANNTVKNWVQYFVFDDTGKTVGMYANTNYDSVAGKYVLKKEDPVRIAKKYSNFEACKNTILQEDKRDSVPFYKVRVDDLALYSPFRNAWWSQSFEVKDSENGKKTIKQYFFFKNYTIEKVIQKQGDKPAKNIDIAEIEQVNKKSVAELFFQTCIEDLHEFDNTKLSFKICNESDVPAVTP